jgi:hypothetical protein
MAYPPSKYSPEYFKPQKPANHSCCGGGCGTPTEHKVIVKRGCFIRYQVNSSGTTHRSSNGSSYKTC